MQDMLSKYWIHLQSQYVIVDTNGLLAVWHPHSS